MKESIIRAAGFDKEVDRVKANLCPFCGNIVNPDTEFKDGLSRKEFGISGLCQACQDKMFGR